MTDLSVLETSAVLGKGYVHTAYYRTTVQQSDKLHIYIGGDGQPWLGRNKIALDPSDQSDLALKLMLKDSGPAVFLARPCYFLSAQSYREQSCEPSLWTNGRYSQAVVDSLVAATNTLIKRHSAGQVVLIGYSGGGTLAVLMAKRIAQLNTLVTIAANLDTDAWADFHEYSPLSRSLNPRATKLQNDLTQIHMVGDKDKNTPAALNQNFYSLNQIEPQVIEGFNHYCCWESVWPIKEIRQES